VCFVALGNQHARVILSYVASVILSYVASVILPYVASVILSYVASVILPYVASVILSYVASVILSYVASPALQNSSTLSHKLYNFRGKKILNYKWGVLFSARIKLPSETFLIL
jgi:hypothetical protein